MMRWRIVLVALAALSMPAAATTGTGAASLDEDFFLQPTLRALVPQFVLGPSAASVDFAWSCSECVSIEYLVVVNEQGLPAGRTDETPTGAVASGTWPHESAGSSEGVVHFPIDLPPGTYFLQVATRAVEAVAWDVSEARRLPVLSAADDDGDGLPDELEHVVCTDRDMAYALDSGYPETCVEDDVAMAGSALLEVPQPVAVGGDDDADGFTNHLRIHSTRIQLVPGEVHVEALPSRLMEFDTWNGTAPGMGRYFHCAPLPRPYSLLLGRDQDGDGLPETVDARVGDACLDRRPSEPRLSASPTGLWWARVDGNDSFADDTPPGPLRLLQMRLLTSFGQDADGDGLPAAAHMLHAEAVYDAAGGSHALQFRTAWDVRPWDTKDDDQDWPTLHARYDGDQDGIPDATEVEACALQDVRTTKDGDCSLTGDYWPPVLYRTSFRAPSDEDKDADHVQDDHEALSCDTMWRRAGSSAFCNGDDLSLD